jgi:hypothetical protein
MCCMLAGCVCCCLFCIWCCRRGALPCLVAVLVGAGVGVAGAAAASAVARAQMRTSQSLSQRATASQVSQAQQGCCVLSVIIRKSQQKGAEVMQEE